MLNLETPRLSHTIYFDASGVDDPYESHPLVLDSDINEYINEWDINWAALAFSGGNACLRIYNAAYDVLWATDEDEKDEAEEAFSRLIKGA